LPHVNAFLRHVRRHVSPRELEVRTNDAASGVGIVPPISWQSALPGWAWSVKRRHRLGVRQDCEPSFRSSVARVAASFVVAM
jgi:hypothetical protein